MLKTNRKKLSEKARKKLETISIIGLIAFALVSHFLTNVIFKKTTKEILIFSNGTQITSIDGTVIDNTTSGTFTLNDENGDFNTLEIHNGKIKCIDSNCPDKLCVSHGYLNEDIDNDMIVCAPHKLIIQYK